MALRVRANTRHARWRTAFAAMVVIAVVLGVVGWNVARPAHAIPTAPPDPSRVVRDDIVNPDERPVDITRYRVPAGQPRTITIPAINATAIIQKVGITDGRRLAAPENIHVAGWYEGSEVPGANGLSLIDGHVSGRTQDGVFKNIKKLVAGDSISIEMGDGGKKTFEVISVRQVAVEKAGEEMVKMQPGIAAQLTLVTCGGAFDRSSQTYRDRVIVVAKAR